MGVSSRLNLTLLFVQECQSTALFRHRYSFYHLLEPFKVLTEMYRVCKPNGCIIVTDVAFAKDIVNAFNAMEKLRDPSHSKVLTIATFEEKYKQIELRNHRRAGYTVEVELEKQLNALFPDQGDEKKFALSFSKILALIT